jgi:hypothetical protein
MGRFYIKGAAHQTRFAAIQGIGKTAVTIASGFLHEPEQVIPHF